MLTGCLEILSKVSDLRSRFPVQTKTNPRIKNTITITPDSYITV